MDPGINITSRATRGLGKKEGPPRHVLFRVRIFPLQEKKCGKRQGGKVAANSKNAWAGNTSHPMSGKMVGCHVHGGFKDHGGKGRKALRKGSKKMGRGGRTWRKLKSSTR